MVFRIFEMRLFFFKFGKCSVCVFVCVYVCVCEIEREGEKENVEGKYFKFFLFWSLFIFFFC